MLFLLLFVIVDHAHGAPDQPPTPAADAGAVEDASPVERKEIEKVVNCTCEDNCGKLLANCICGFSDTMRKEIDALISAGMTKTEVLDALVERYGIRVLAAPGSSNWLDLLAWTVPFLALALGAWLVIYMVRRLTGRVPATEPASETRSEPAAEGSTASAYENRLDEELSRFEP